MSVSVDNLSHKNIAITLPDGSVKTYDKPVTPLEIAHSIGSSLAKSALAAVINGKLCDLWDIIHQDTAISIITSRQECEALELIRHDTAHILAMAVQELFPGTQVTIGPNIKDGFYYDFYREQPFTPDDLNVIESKMLEIIDRDEKTRKETWPHQKAIDHFKSIGEHFKAELVEAIPENEDVKIYFHGDWHDLCRGPHLPSTGKIPKAFKLLKLSGAYWRGDHTGPQLQRIYGTAWRDKKELKAYLNRLEEAEKRDHRKIGRALDLFHQQDEAAGMVFWHPKGNALWRVLEDYMRRQMRQYAYEEVRTPQLVDRTLWEKSGHWEKFSEHMYTSHSEERIFALKPMNCPCHVQIFNKNLISYKQLPLRMYEFGSCHRYEPSGALHGIMRVRNFTQDDAHIFCTEDQITQETITYCNMLARIYKDLGFDKFRVKFSDRPEKRAGSDAIWDKSEAALHKAVIETGYDVELNPGEGAFYGPKLEFVLTDAIGRDWQCGTLQVDFVLPERLGAEYVDHDNSKKRPVMLHRAILGSFERFIGILIEQYAGRFPTWMAPQQLSILTITSDADNTAHELADLLHPHNIRLEVDTRNEKINYKIRQHMTSMVPILAILGKKEAENKTVSVRRLGSEEQFSLNFTEFVDFVKKESTPPDL